MEEIDYNKIDEIFAQTDSDLEYVNTILNKAKKLLNEN